MHHPNQDWHSKFSLNILWDCSCNIMSKRAHHNPHSFLCVESTKMVFAVVIPRACFVLLGTVSPALPVDSPALFMLQVLHAWCAFHVSWRLWLFMLLVFCFFVDPDAHAVGDQGHEIAWSACCFSLRGSPGFIVAFVALVLRQLTHL